MGRREACVVFLIPCADGRILAIDSGEGNMQKLQRWERRGKTNRERGDRDGARERGKRE